MHMGGLLLSKELEGSNTFFHICFIWYEALMSIYLVFKTAFAKMRQNFRNSHLRINYFTEFRMSYFVVDVLNKSFFLAIDISNRRRSLNSNRLSFQFFFAYELDESNNMTNYSQLEQVQRYRISPDESLRSSA